MPVDEVPAWVQLLAGVVGGGLGMKIIDAAKARGLVLSKERVIGMQLDDKGEDRNVAERASLRIFEDGLRKSLLDENRAQRARLDALEDRLMELIENERKCDERARALEAEVLTLRDKNDELRRDLDAITKALDEQSRRIISESSSERRAHRDNLRTLRDSVAHTLDAQKARHGS